MRTFISITLFLLLATVGLFSVAMVPYHFYETAISEGIDSEFLSMEAPKKGFLAPTAKSLSAVEERQEEKIWKEFHFSNYIIPMPVHHPLFLVVPHIADSPVNDTEFGAIFRGFNEKDYVFFQTLPVQDFKVDLGVQKIFNLPIFKKSILRKSKRQIWKDVMSYSTLLPKKNKGQLDYYKKLWSISYDDLVYGLFIIQLRNRIFPENAHSFSYDAELEVGTLEIHEFGVDDTALLQEGLEPLYQNELVVFYHKGQIHQLKLRTLYDDKTAAAYRRRFMKTLEYKLSEEDSIVPIYADYKRLDYKRRIDQEGMVYLFSSWTHMPENSVFLEEMIRFLERGGSQYEQLSPLYQYAFDHFGSNFSTRENTLRETENQKMIRFMKEKAQRDAEKEAQRKLSSEEVIPEGEERIEFLLQKAKESGHSENENKRLLIED